MVKWLNDVDIKAQTTPKRLYNVVRVLAILTLTLFGVVCGETIFTANLSDLRFLKVKSPDPVPIELLLIMMNEGKYVMAICEFILYCFITPSETIFLEQ